MKKYKSELILAALTLALIIILALVMIVPIDSIAIMRATILDYFSITFFAFVVLAIGAEVFRSLSTRYSKCKKFVNYLKLKSKAEHEIWKFKNMRRLES